MLERDEAELAAHIESCTDRLGKIRTALSSLRQLCGESEPKRTAATSERRVSRPTASVAAPSGFKAGTAGAPAAAERDRAVLALVAGGCSSTADIRAKLPKPNGLTTMQHESAVRNSLTRLQGASKVTRGESGWIVTGRPSAAAATAKEVP